MHPVTTFSLRPSLASIARRSLQALTARLADARAAWKLQRQTRATAHALGLLDRRTLQDLALDRSELLSAAAELHGQARRERRHARCAAPLPP